MPPSNDIICEQSVENSGVKGVVRGEPPPPGPMPPLLRGIPSREGKTSFLVKASASPQD